jgi:protein involved in polysaccharide export with SLBB domain
MQNSSSAAQLRFPIRKKGMGVLLLAALLFCGGCQSTKTVTISDRSMNPTRGCLVPGDVVRLSFSGASEFNQIQKVRSDGRINLPMVGEVVAEGKKPGDLQRELCATYKSQLRNSEVVVAVENSAIPVYVSGSVNKPGKLVIDRPTTVLEAIMEAGGFQTGYANPRKVLLVRNTNGRHQPITLDLSGALKGRPMDAIYVNANDVIYVPESLF